MRQKILPFYILFSYCKNLSYSIPFAISKLIFLSSKNGHKRGHFSSFQSFAFPKTTAKKKKPNPKNKWSEKWFAVSGILPAASISEYVPYFLINATDI